MSYLINRNDVLDLLNRLALRSNRPKIDILHDALEVLADKVGASPTVWDATLEAGLSLRALGDPSAGRPVDKAFIDSLYEDRDVS